MTAYTTPSSYNYDILDSGPKDMDDLWADEDFWTDLADAINRNFVLEVESSRTTKDGA